MSNTEFSHVRAWVFDLDNTLYPPAARLFDQIEVRMTAYVMDALGVSETEANRLRVHYWRTHGTTLAGLMREHQVDPAPYLNEVHDITLDHLEKYMEKLGMLTYLSTCYVWDQNMRPIKDNGTLSNKPEG